MDTVELEPLLYVEKQNKLEEIIKYFDTKRMGYIKVPTGWGKTFLAKHLMKLYYEQGKIILFLVSGNNQLLNQTFYSDLKRKKPLFPNSFVLSSEHERKDTADFVKGSRGTVIFASIQTVLSERNEDIKIWLARNADLVVVDEIHNFIHTKGNNFISEIGEQARVLGMTATPFQGIVGHVKFVDEIADDMREIFSKTLPQCIIDGQLSELEYTIIRSNESILDIFDFSNGLEALNSQEIYLDCGSLEKVNTLIKRTQLAKRIHEERITSDNSKTLVFCAPVKNLVRGFGEGQEKITAFHAKVCSAIFNGEVKEKIDESFSFDNYTQAGQFKNAAYLSSDLPKKERDDILTAFRVIDEPPFVLCTVGMLIEGFDFPDLENLILLRPTLSMRLFEQQVGRVTRLPKESNKKQGNIFEIADNVDSLYDAFKDEVFEGKNIERIQLLQPEERIGELFHDDNNTLEAVKAGKIKISDLNFGDSINEFKKSSVEIPPVSLRAKLFRKLLSIIEKRTYGKFAQEREKMMQMAIGFKIHNVDSAEQISNLAVHLKQLEHEASEDNQLSINGAKYKPLVLKEVRWLLMLRALTYLHYSCKVLSSIEKSNILSILGFIGDYGQMQDYRIQCLKNGTDMEIMNIDEVVKNLKDGIASLDQLKEWEKDKKHFPGAGKVHTRKRKELLPLIYWASCFTMDNPQIREILESPKYNYDIKKYAIG